MQDVSLGVGLFCASHDVYTVLNGEFIAHV